MWFQPGRTVRATGCHDGDRRAAVRALLGCCHGGWSSLLAFQLVHDPNEKKYGERNNNKADDVVDKEAEVNGDCARRFRRSQRGVRAGRLAFFKNYEDV